MLGQGMAELLPATDLEDVVIFPNPKDPFHPIVKTFPSGQGKKIVEEYKNRVFADLKRSMGSPSLWIFFALMFIWIIVDYFIYSEINPVLRAAKIIAGTIWMAILLFLFVVFLSLRQVPGPLIRRNFLNVPKLLIDNSDKETAPFVDATGLHEGALLGDVLHDPYQSGGLETPAHLRVIPGAIHKAHKGVLFIDEIGMLKPEMQIAILTAMQEKKFPITGRAERSAGAMVQTDPVPCDFILVAAGTPETIQFLHPALRSRIRGYGYEVFMNSEIEDNPKNRKKLARFVAQEVKKRKLLHFTREAVIEIIKEARKMAGRRGYLTLRLRELGGLVQAASDIAAKKGKKYVEPEDVLEAKKYARTLEKQITDRVTDIKREYQIIINKGEIVGRVNGLAVFSAGGEWGAGIVLPIEASVVPSMEKGRGKIIATGKLGEIAKEAIQNVSAIIKKISDKDLSNYDIHIQFLQTYEGVEGDSASISVATAVLSSLFNIPVRQDTAMTGSLSIRGEVLPVGGINEKIESAYEAGIKRVIIPKANLKDVLVSEKIRRDLKIIPVENIFDVLENTFVMDKRTAKMIKEMRKKLEI